MKRESAGPILSTVFVDYDNIYLSLKRKNEDAAKRFAKDSSVWLNGLITGELITPASGFQAIADRRIVMNRCYGNSQPRRNAHDNSTDMNSFPFVRHHFMRAGFEVIDCPPLTAQLKNSADIRIVMDIRDIIAHDTYFDEFIILSGDADFTPVLHRLRAHARRTVVFANDQTAQPYTAISDGEVRESSLIAMLLNSRTVSVDTGPRELAAPEPAPLTAVEVEAARNAIVTEVVNTVRTAPQAVPLETLADRAVRVIGRDKTIGSNWGGFGSFRELLLSDLPEDLHLSDTAPYTVFDANRHITANGLLTPQLPAPSAETRQIEVTPRVQAQAPVQTQSQPQMSPEMAQPRGYQQQQPQRYAQQTAAPTQAPANTAPTAAMPAMRRAPEAPPAAPQRQEAQRHEPQRHEMMRSDAQRPEMQQRNAMPPQELPRQYAQHVQSGAPTAQPAMQSAPTAPPQQQPQAEMRRDVQRPAAPPVMPQASRTADQATQIQQSIARIHDACQAPALAPAEYRVLFDVMAQEITANGLQGSQTLANVTQRAREFGLDLKRDDLRFILEVVSESDPWFEQGASANLFAGRFRNFVVARCRSQGLSLSADEIDLVEAWFSSAQPAQARQPAYGRTPQAPQQAPAAPAPQQTAAPTQQQPSGERWWSLEEGRQHIAEQRAQGNYALQEEEDEFPRIVRTRLRG